MKIQLQFHRPEILKPFIPKTKDAPVDATDPMVNKDRELHAIRRGNRHRVLGEWVTRTRQTGQDPLIHELVEKMLTPPAAGELPEFKEEAWTTICDFDARRQGQENCATMLGDKTFQRVRTIAADTEHPCRFDAQLLIDIMTRPLGENPPSLEGYLSGLVSMQVQKTIGENFNTTPECDFTTREGIVTFVRTFNGLMQGVALNSQDYTSIGRTLILKGATHLSAWTDPPLAKPGGTTNTSANDSLAKRLQQATFCFPTVPAEGSSTLELNDFDAVFNFETMEMDPNPLEQQFGMQFYLDADSYQTIEAAKAESLPHTSRQ